MAEIVRMPKMSDTMTEGVVARWHKNVGDNIKSGDLVAEIETDKATMEFESYQNGTLLYRGVDEGKAVPVNGVLAVLGEPGEDYKPLLEAEKSNTSSVPAETQTSKAGSKPQATAPKPASATKPAETPKPVSAAPVAASPSQQSASSSKQQADTDSRIKASPLAKRLADEKGIDLSKLKGTGDNGRVIKRDIDWYKPGTYGQAEAIPGAVTEESFEDVTVSQMRKTIALRLTESKFTAPHFYLTIDINMEQAIAARESIVNVTGLKISFNDLVIKAAATALRQHPKVNSSWYGDFIRINHHIHIGVAVAVEDGLLVPVVRFADSKTLSQINAEVKDYAQRAKDKKLQPADWQGNTFTISNLGMFEIEEFTAIINPPDACILAIGAIKETPVVKDFAVVPGDVMRVTLSCDHRVVDGVTGARFLQTFKGLLENPIVLLGQASI